MTSIRSRMSTGNDSSRSLTRPPSRISRLGLPLTRISMCPPFAFVKSPRAATRLRSVKYELAPVSPGTRSRTSRNVVPPNRRSSSRPTTEITPGASDSVSADFDAVITLMSSSDARSRASRSSP